MNWKIQKYNPEFIKASHHLKYNDKYFFDIEKIGVEVFNDRDFGLPIVQINLIGKKKESKIRISDKKDVIAMITMLEEAKKTMES